MYPSMEKCKEADKGALCQSVGHISQQQKQYQCLSNNRIAKGMVECICQAFETEENPLFLFGYQ